MSDPGTPLLARYVAVHACPDDGMVRVGIRTPPKYGSRPTAEMPCTCEAGSHAVVVMIRRRRDNEAVAFEIDEIQVVEKP
jgi:hypothetical protein